MANKTASLLQSFAPVLGVAPKVLILGSMPGKHSLATQQYYAHPHNLFWAYMAQILGFSEKLTYQEKLQQLMQHRIALWDVLKHCERNSSLDSDINPVSMVANDIAGLLARQPTITHIYFNGGKAQQVFQRVIAPQLANIATLQLTRLPSTSPANASIPRDEKLRQWRQIVIALSS